MGGGGLRGCSPPIFIRKMQQVVLFSPKIVPQTISEGLKSQIFLGGHAPRPPSLELLTAAYKFSPPKVKLFPTPMHGFCNLALLWTVTGGH